MASFPKKFRVRRSEEWALIGDDILKMCQSIIKQEADYINQINADKTQESLDLLTRVRQDKIKHMYAKEILDSELKPVFKEDKEYSVFDVAKAGYCSYFANMPCERGTEAFHCDCYGNPKRLFQCKNKIVEVLGENETLCPKHIKMAEHRKEQLSLNRLREKEHYMKNTVFNFIHDKLKYRVRGPNQKCPGFRFGRCESDSDEASS